MRVELRAVLAAEVDQAMAVLQCGREHLAEQGIDQWQDAYPERWRIEEDVELGRAFFAVLEEEPAGVEPPAMEATAGQEPVAGGETAGQGPEIIGYVCVDLAGEPAYTTLEGEWGTPEQFAVVHRMAFTHQARGRGFSTPLFEAIGRYAVARGTFALRVDTEENNLKMQHVLAKAGFVRRGPLTIYGLPRIGFDKQL